jgi:thioredoxin 1
MPSKRQNNPAACRGTRLAIIFAMSTYQNPAPSRAEIDAEPGPVLLEFGTAWCGHCQAAAPAIRAALAEHPGVRHIAVEDGPGRRLGRSFGVKLWPTLVFLQDGVEVARLVRPTAFEPIRDALERIA